MSENKQVRIFRGNTIKEIQDDVNEFLSFNCIDCISVNFSVVTIGPIVTHFAYVLYK